jgi:hypothetical protein
MDFFGISRLIKQQERGSGDKFIYLFLGYHLSDVLQITRDYHEMIVQIAFQTYDQYMGPGASYKLTRMTFWCHGMHEGFSIYVMASRIEAAISMPPHIYMTGSAFKDIIYHEHFLSVISPRHSVNADFWRRDTSEMFW